MQNETSSAVVIGGTHGMGLAISKALLARGERVLVTGRNEQNVRAAQRELGERAQVVRSDVANMAEIRSLAARVKSELGRVRTLFLNVGISELAPFAEVSEESYDRQLAINSKGVFFTVQQLHPLMMEGGAMVMTTVTPAPAFPNMAVYMASKGALTALMRSLAAELLPRNIRVNAVAPGFIDTPTLGIAAASAEERAALRAMGDAIVPMKRHGAAEEVARAAMFLAFDATYTTGVELPVDGGLSHVESVPAP